MEKIAAYPGSFDPITNGHVDILKRALKIFDKVVVAVYNEPPKKKVLFSAEERVQMIKEATKGLNVETDVFSGLLVDYLKKKKINFVVRGLRALSDFDYEFQMAVVNKKLQPDIETIFIVTDKQYFYLNSTLVKELAYHNGSIEDMVPENVAKKLKEKFSA